MSEFEHLTKLLVDFRDEREWKQFHNSKDLAVAVSIESSELLELFLWKNAEDVNLEKLKEELADVFAYGLLLANNYGLDIHKIIEEKIRKNGEKYPVDKAKGSSKKYTEL